MSLSCMEGITCVVVAVRPLLTNFENQFLNNVDFQTDGSLSKIVLTMLFSKNFTYAIGSSIEGKQPTCNHSIMWFYCEGPSDVLLCLQNSGSCTHFFVKPADLKQLHLTREFATQRS